MTSDLDRFCQWHTLPDQHAWTAWLGILKAGVEFWKRAMARWRIWPTRAAHLGSAPPHPRCQEAPARHPCANRERRGRR